MTINSKFKSLLAIALLSGMSSFAAETAEDSKSLAPEISATVKESAFSHKRTLLVISFLRLV